MNAFYVIAAAISWGCIGTVLIFDIVFGFRALFHVKREYVTELPKGFSPLDYQRVMRAKTSPHRLTRALLVWWAQKGYIRIEGRGGSMVRVWKLKNMPSHEEAEFYDRGTYVREREIFNYVFSEVNLNTGFKDINLHKPLVGQKSGEAINKSFSIGENEGVFGTGHFLLKIITQVLCIVPYFLAIAWATYNTGNTAEYVGFSIFSVIGVLALKYLTPLPAAIRYPFFAIWGGAPYGALVSSYVQNVYDPWYFGYAALALYVVGTFILILFADYREKENLKEYSLLFNYRNHLFFMPKKAVDPEDYYNVLPFLYTIRLAPVLKRKFRSEKLPDWYQGKRGSLL
ncbi:MAG: hypothetical protein HDP28_03335 [Clostridia bacterium]|nr:hypothetical protein [Clostridia bacterium]